mgnify:CR=1 FL=1
MLAEFRWVTADAVRPLRYAILRPDEPPEHSIYPGDDAPEARHIAVYEDGRLVGVASVLHQPPPGESDPLAWRVRGVATLPDVRGRHYGVGMMRRLVVYAAQQGGTRMWGYGRLEVKGFYERLGFRYEGEVLDIGRRNERQFMWRPVTEQDTISVHG